MLKSRRTKYLYKVLISAKNNAKSKLLQSLKFINTLTDKKIEHLAFSEHYRSCYDYTNGKTTNQNFYQTKLQQRIFLMTPRPGHHCPQPGCKIWRDRHEIDIYPYDKGVFLVRIEGANEILITRNFWSNFTNIELKLWSSLKIVKDIAHCQ